MDEYEKMKSIAYELKEVGEVLVNLSEKIKKCMNDLKLLELKTGERPVIGSNNWPIDN